MKTYFLYALLLPAISNFDIRYSEFDILLDKPFLHY